MTSFKVDYGDKPLLGGDRKHLLLGFFLPDSVIATKSMSDTINWQEGDKRSIFHDCWKLCSDDKNIKRHNIEFIVSFDSIIDVDEKKLSDERYLCDNITKKIMCVVSLISGYANHPLCAQSTVALCDYFDWIIRWRNSLHIYHLSEIRKAHFEQYTRLVRNAEVIHLIPIIDRLHSLVNEVRSGAFTLPVTPSTRNAGAFVLNWTALAGKLGVTRPSLVNSNDFLYELIDSLPTLDPVNAAILAKTLPPPTAARVGMKRSSRSVKALLDPWVCLWTLSQKGFLTHDPLSFDPFKEKSARSIMNEMGRPSERTITLQPTDFLRLLDASARWVLDFAPHILCVLKRAEEVTHDNKFSSQIAAARLRVMREMDKIAPTGMPMIWPGLKTPKRGKAGYEPSRLSLGAILKMLMTACAILVIGFGARRVGEAMSLRSNCLIEEKPGLCELSVFIEKTMRDIDRIPVPIMIKLVVATLESITESSRLKTGEPWLFQIVRTSGNGERPYLHLATTKLMNDFCAINDLPPPDGFEQWALKPHQLRRGFAVCYYHGNLVASLDALSRFLRHFDPEVTRIYINDVISGIMGRLREDISARTKAGFEAMSYEDKKWLSTTRDILADIEARGQIFDEVRCEHTVYKMLSMFEGIESPIGRAAAKLYCDLRGMVDAAAAGIRVGSRANSRDAIRLPLMDLLKEYARCNFLEPVPGNIAHCTCRPGNDEDLATAECLKAKASAPRSWSESTPTQDVRPDYSFSGAYPCLNCDHCAAFNDNQQTLELVSQRYSDAASRGATPAAKQTAAAALAKLKSAVNAANAAVKDRG